MIADSPYNFLYTINVSLGNPGQNSTYIVDINYPLTISFTYGSLCWAPNRPPQNNNASAWANCGWWPFYVPNNYDWANSNTFQLFSTNNNGTSYNIFSCGF